MIESWREWLYPLGYLAQIVFSGRFLQQWFQSEAKQRSVVTSNFWQLSLLGNGMLMIHAFIQLQVHVCVIQAFNGVISWRNLNFMQEESRRWRFASVILFMLAALAGVLLLFLAQNYFWGNGMADWFRIPKGSENVRSPLWHLMGSIGLILFSSRFWIQWVYAERSKTSYLGLPFWWMSTLGGVLSLIYFALINDPVNAIGPAVGLIPYVRNLVLIYRFTGQRST